MSPFVTAAGVAEEVRLLFFRSGGERFAIDVAYVREILPAPVATPVPFVPDSVAGIINHRGAIFTLINFGRLAGLPGTDAGAEVVLLRLPEMAVGIFVGGVEGIEAVPAGFLACGGEAGAVPEVPFLSRTSDARGRLVHAVDAEKLIDVIYQLPELLRGAEG